MSNYPNMSYCMNENTLQAMRQVVDAMQNEGPQFLQELSQSERWAFQELFQVCEEFMKTASELEEQAEEYED